MLGCVRFDHHRPYIEHQPSDRYGVCQFFGLVIKHDRLLQCAHQVVHVRIFEYQACSSPVLHVPGAGIDNSVGKPANLVYYRQGSVAQAIELV